ncbi:glycogen synthase GlgA [Phenylobacterium deserti]|uniref:Glycogen synthase n=1 Tax=Phenylobacterium deserti TaxID=1914756 RepID=A0A328AC89_9CAUL|nr:glycogen synthase GlgA [Phenylobacterium deserti]RAK52225.1 glycogen synthase GlgA [Phenylobacterium deserti]
MTGPVVLSVAAEVFPLIKTGGLADVVGALPHALEKEGVRVQTLVPGYPAVMSALETSQVVHKFPDLMGGEADLLRARAKGLDLFVLDAPHLYDRPGNPYLQKPNVEWADNGVRFAALALVGAEIGTGLLDDYRPDVIQAHDWHAGLLPAYLHYSGKAAPPVVLSIHNLAFQGRFPAHLLGKLGKLGLPESAMGVDGVEYYGDIGFLKAGIRFADQITTVSPSYANEITTEAGGMGLGGLLKTRSRDLVGILNGIDIDVWNPATDPDLPAQYDATCLDRRAINKAELQRRFGLKQDPRKPLFGIVSRLTTQKGVDLLLSVLPQLFAEGAQLVVVGMGDPSFEEAFRRAEEQYPGCMGEFFGYSEELTHLTQGGADAILAPSRFEPCGLTQLCAMRYGALPVVSRTGGLSDTIIDANSAAMARSAATGVQFWPANEHNLEEAIRRTCALYRHPKIWRNIQLNAMAADSSWRFSAAIYADLFRNLAGMPAPSAEAIAEEAASQAKTAGTAAELAEPRSFEPATEEPVEQELRKPAAPRRLRRRTAPAAQARAS